MPLLMIFKKRGDRQGRSDISGQWNGAIKKCTVGHHDQYLVVCHAVRVIMITINEGVSGKLCAVISKLNV